MVNVAILGTLAAGKIYVPMDSKEPTESLAAKLRNAGARVLMTDQKLEAAARACAPRDCRVVVLPQDAAAAPTTDPRVTLSADKIAYIYYTSGSTGAPKGVFDDHRNVLHNILRYTNSLQIGCDDRLSLIQAPSFSGTVSTLFGALLNGAAVFPFDLRSEGIGALGQLVRHEELTMFHSVPTIFEAMISTQDAFPSLRTIRLEGDQAFHRHVELLRQHFSPHCVLVNGLGATETGLTRQFFIDHNTRIDGSVVPIGYPTEDMEAVVVSPDLQELPPGEVGEILIRSRYLAKGYWCQDELTQRAFIESPTGDPIRSYRTGDLGRLGENGCLEYLGRSDFRVKIHGKWVDLEAIQNEITALPGVSDAIVLSRPHQSQGPRIVAYVVADLADPGMRLEAAALREAVAGRLPPDMLPAHYVLLPTLPLDANGKIDRKALPDPEADKAGAADEAARPQSEIEIAFAKCWREALGREVGIHDDFFAIGGYSLQGLKLVLLVEQALSAKLDLSFLVENPTISAMAGGLQKEWSAPLLLKLRAGSKQPLFCVHAHGGEVFPLRVPAEAMASDRPVYAFSARHLSPAEGAHADVGAIATEYLTQMRTVQPTGPYFLCGYCFGGLVALEMAQQLTEGGDSVAFLALIGTEAAGASGAAPPRLWLQRHWQRMRARPRRTWPDYVANLVRNSMEKVLLLAGQRGRALLWRLNMGRGMPILRRLWSIEFLHGLATHAHRPSAYKGGSTIVFTCHPNATSPRAPYDGWSRLVPTGLTLREINATHGNALKKPAVTKVARDLDEALARASAL